MKYFVWIFIILQSATLNSIAVAQVANVQQKMSVPKASQSPGNQRRQGPALPPQKPVNSLGGTTQPIIPLPLSTVELLKLRHSMQKEGGVSTGGGDHFVVDFIQTALTEVYPWAKQNQSLVDADIFVKVLAPERIRSVERLFESCQFSDSKTGNLQAVRKDRNDPERAACYDQTKDIIFLNRSLYPTGIKRDPSKMSLVAHELLRRANLEGNEYLITGQWDFRKPFNTVLVSDDAMEFLVDAESDLNNLVHAAKQACDSGNQISSYEISKKLAGVSEAMQVANALIRKALKKTGLYFTTGHACMPFDLAYLYSYIVSIGNPYMKLKVQLEYNKEKGHSEKYPACHLIEDLKLTQRYTSIAVASARRHRSGSNALMCEELGI